MMMIDGTQTCAAVRASAELHDERVRRRITLIWLLLLFNGLPWIGVPTVIAIPQRLGQLISVAALGLALLLALELNPRLAIRPNVVLTLFTVLLAVGFVSSVRWTAGLGALLRSGRLAAFLAVLWLLTPWWGRRDLLLARCHLRALTVMSLAVVAGLLVAPSTALSGPDGRLVGALWPMWPTAVAHVAGVAAGMGTVLWLSRSLPPSRALLLAAGGLSLVLLSHTRVALVGLVAGLVCATFSLVLVRQRARRTVTVGLLLAPILVVALSPWFAAWFVRGQSEQELRSLTGRKDVWVALLNEPRPEFNQWFGMGLSDKGFFGKSIDNSWLAVYQDQGLVGVALLGTVVLFLLLAPAFREAGPARALAIFIVVFSAFDSYTEVGLGDASPYLLDLVVAASLLFTSPNDEDPVPGDVVP